MRPPHSSHAVTEVVSCFSKFDIAQYSNHANNMALDRGHRSSSPQRGNDKFSDVAVQGKLHIVAAGFTDGSVNMWGGKS